MATRQDIGSRLRALVRSYEYEDWPRGRIVFDPSRDLFGEQEMSVWTVITNAPVIIRSSYSTSSVTWNDVRFVPATSTAPTDGRVC
jgi:hypothetical protein